MRAAAAWPWLRFLAVVAVGAVIGLRTFDSMQSMALKAIAGGCMGAALALLFLLDQKPGDRLLIATGCGGLVFVALGLLWYSTPGASAVLLLVAVGVAAVIAWGALKI
ncbi:MAG: hypothetical protein AB1514_12225 [Pseudomonadota bacterium]